MGKSRVLFYLSIVLAICSCNNDIEELSTTLNQENHLVQSDRLTDALNRADRLLGKIEGRTRNDVRLVESVKFVNYGHSTRGESIDSLYWIVNYADNKGFAVLGATEDTDGIYAISGEGHLEQNDAIENPGLAMFFESLPRTIPTRPGFEIDSTMNDKPILNYNEDLSTQIKPMLAQSVRSWHQLYPYNRECTLNGVSCPAGCAPLAIAMIMTYYEWPQTYKSLRYDWQAIKSAYSPIDVISANIPILIKEIGSKENLNTTYNTIENGGSSTLTETTYKRTFEHFGYKTPGNFKDFSLDGLADFIRKNEKPVLMRGEKSNNVGHVWIIDGYYYDLHRSSMVLGEYYGEGYLFHAVWGWGSSCNGYFKISDRFIPMPDFNGEGDDKSFSESEYNQVQYQKIRYMGDLVPNK